VLKWSGIVIPAHAGSPAVEQSMTVADPISTESSKHGIQLLVIFAALRRAVIVSGPVGNDR